MIVAIYRLAVSFHARLRICTSSVMLAAFAIAVHPHNVRADFTAHGEPSQGSYVGTRDGSVYVLLPGGAVTLVGRAADYLPEAINAGF